MRSTKLLAWVCSATFATVVTVAGVVHARLASFETAGGANEAQFSASGPGGLTIVGKSAGAVSVSEDGDNITIVVALDGLDTGIARRNRHMHEKYLHTARYPDAVLVVPRAELPLPRPGQHSVGTTTGKMTLHGRSAPVNVHFDVLNEGGVYQVSGWAPVNIKTFGIQVPRYYGITVKPDIRVDVIFSARNR